MNTNIRIPVFWESRGELLGKRLPTLNGNIHKNLPSNSSSHPRRPGYSVTRRWKSQNSHTTPTCL